MRAWPPHARAGFFGVTRGGAVVRGAFNQIHFAISRRCQYNRFFAKDWPIIESNYLTLKILRVNLDDGLKRRIPVLHRISSAGGERQPPRASRDLQIDLFSRPSEWISDCEQGKRYEDSARKPA
jgi:hypothetical protein